MKKKRIYGLKQHLIKQVIGNIELKLIISLFLCEEKIDKVNTQIHIFLSFF